MSCHLDGVSDEAAGETRETTPLADSGCREIQQLLLDTHLIQQMHSLAPIFFDLNE